MKKLFVIFFLLAFAAFNVKAQEQKSLHYVFPDFVDAVIKFKTGADLKVKLNYNTITEEMIYLQNGKAMAIAETNKIDTVYLKDLKFVPVKEGFYQVVPVKNTPLFVRITSKAIPPPTNVGIGISQTTAQSATSTVRTETGLYSLELPYYKIVRKNEYYLKKGDQYVRLVNANSLALFYPEKSKEIKKYAKDNHISFDKTEDVSKLLGLID